MNTIRLQPSDEPAREGRSPSHSTRETEARDGAVGVVGGSMSGKGSDVNTGDLSGTSGVHGRKPEEPPGRSQSIHSSWEAGNDRGAKGCRKVEVRRNDRRTKENQRECPRGLASGGDSQVQLAWLTPKVRPTDLGTRRRAAPSRLSTHRLESRMRESRTSGSEGGAEQPCSVPTPIHDSPPHRQGLRHRASRPLHPARRDRGVFGERGRRAAGFFDHEAPRRDG